MLPKINKVFHVIMKTIKCKNNNKQQKPSKAFCVTFECNPNIQKAEAELL